MEINTAVRGVYAFKNIKQLDEVLELVTVFKLRSSLPLDIAPRWVRGRDSGRREGQIFLQSSVFLRSVVDSVTICSVITDDVFGKDT